MIIPNLFLEMKTKMQLFNDGDAIFIVFGDSTGKPATNIFKSYMLVGQLVLLNDTTIAEVNRIHPRIWDVYKIVTNKPFRNGEFYEFTTKAQKIDKSKAKSELDDIAVVPNPYVGAASWEAFSNELVEVKEKFILHIYQMNVQLEFIQLAVNLLIQLSITALFLMVK